MNNMWNPSANLRWFPDASEVEAPEGALLRADNTIPDRGGVSLRMGSRILHQDLDDRVHSLRSLEIGGTLWRLAGAGDRLFGNGVVLGDAVTFDGSGDFAMGDDSYQILVARGTTRKKWDGSNLFEWSIPAPTVQPQVLAIDVITAQPATFDSAESPAFSISEPGSSRTWETGHDGTTPNGSMKLVPAPGTGRASASKKFASDQEYFDIGGMPGGPNDLFDVRVWFEDWRRVDKVTVMFGLDTGTDPFKDNYYYFDWNIRNKDTVNIKDAASATASAYGIASRKTTNILSPQQVTNIRTPTQAGEILRRLGRFAGPRSTERRDAYEASPAWGHLIVTRGQFNRVGGTPGRNWSTVRGFKVVYTVTPGSSAAIQLDDALWIGGGAQALTGTFTVGFRYARKFTDPNLSEVYYELSPMSPVSPEITLNQQTLQITIPGIALSGKDSQVGEIWVYLNGGWLDTYYRFAVLSATPPTGITIDEITFPTGSNFNTPEKRVRLTSWGFSKVEGGGTGPIDVVFRSNISEVEILIDNEPYTPGACPVPDNIVAIAGPYGGRTFVLDRQGYLWPSGKAPSSFSAYHALDLRQYGTPLWLANTSNGIAAGFSKDIIRITGSGEESDDHVIVDLWPDPMHVGNPPVDSTVMIDGNTIVYRAADGLMALTSGSLVPIPYAGTSLLWRGENRHGVAALNLAGRFRIATDNHILYMLAPEGALDTDPDSVWIYYFEHKQWRRFTYPFTPISIHREPSGGLIVGTTDGKVWEIEYGNQDEGTDPYVTLITPYSDGGSPLRRKDLVDLQLHVDSGSDTGSLELWGDGSLMNSYSFSTPHMAPYRWDVSGMGPIIRAQLRIAGNFSTFSVAGFNITHRPRPQQVMALDLGYIVPPGNGDMAWLVEAEIDCASPAPLTLCVYRGDVLFDSVPVPVTPDVRKPYRVPLKRNSKDYRLRLVVQTTNPPGYLSPGFEPWSVKGRFAGSGNLTQLYIAPGEDAAGGA